MTGALVVEQLQPWFANVRKRQIKAPKIYLRDSGLLHTLLGIRDQSDLERHPKVGASWEGFLLQEVIRTLGATREERYFWGTHTGAELDLLFVRGRKRWGFELERTTAPRVTRSMHTAIDVLDLERLFVIHAGDQSFPMRQEIEAVASKALLDRFS